MRRITSILIFIFQVVILQADPQESAAAPPRTPEQEAAMQTSKMRQELNLSSEQEREIYEINLRHARERQTSTSRSEALKRVRNKEIEFQQVLTRGQYNRLQEKRLDYSPQGVETSGFIQRRTQPVTNPQRIEGGRVISSSEERQQNDIRRSTPTDQNPRSASPSSRTTTPESRRTSPIQSDRPETGRESRRSVPSDEIRRTESSGARPVETPRSTGSPESRSSGRYESRSSGSSESRSSGSSSSRSTGSSESRSTSRPRR